MQGWDECPYNAHVPTLRLCLRRSYRLIRLGLHLLQAIFFAGVLFPLVSMRQRDWLISYWSRHLLKVLGVRIHAQHAPVLSGGALLVSNHISWLDIYLIYGARRVYFVSKAEVRKWPIAGWLAHKGGTLFIERGKRADTARINQEMHDLMQHGAWIGVFPEGTTSDGRGVNKFYSSLLQPAVELECPIVPVAIRYTRNSEYTEVPAYIGGMSLWESLQRIISETGLVAELRFGTPFAPEHHRRELAVHAEAAVAGLLGVAAPSGKRAV